MVSEEGKKQDEHSKAGAVTVSGGGGGEVE